MSDERVKPALTPEEWARGWDAIRNDGVDVAYPWGHGEESDRHWTLDGTFDRHALAALCLHGQPYGFTREDVRQLLDAIETIGEHDSMDPLQYRLASLAARIAALLPPEQTPAT